MDYLNKTFRSPANSKAFRDHWDDVFRTQVPDPTGSRRPAAYALNAGVCGRCGQVVRSLYRHDFRSCGCGAVYVDGGACYVSHGGAVVEDLSRGPQAGDRFVVVGTISTRGGLYAAGDVLELLCRTDEDPYRTGSRDNWVVGCRHYPEGSVWSSFERVLLEGLAYLVWVDRPYV